VPVRFWLGVMLVVLGAVTAWIAVIAEVSQRLARGA
jgi:hypothetical protein